MWLAFKSVDIEEGTLSSIMWVGLIQSPEGSNRLQSPRKKDFRAQMHLGSRQQPQLFSGSLVRRSAPQMENLPGPIVAWASSLKCPFVCPHPFGSVSLGNPDEHRAQAAERHDKKSSSLVPSLMELWSYQRRWIKTTIQIVDNYRDSEKESHEKNLRRPELWKIFQIKHSNIERELTSNHSMCHLILGGRWVCHLRKSYTYKILFRFQSAPTPQLSLTSWVNLRKTDSSESCFFFPLGLSVGCQGCLYVS